MDFAKPYSLFSSSTEGDILAALDRVDTPMSGRQIARVLDGSQATVNRALERLAAHGVVVREPVPPAYTYRINRDHLVYPSIEALMNAQSDFIRFVTGAFKDLNPSPLHGSIFGSVARRTAGVASDVDLLIVWAGEDADADRDSGVESLRSSIEKRTGNRVAVVELSRDRLSASKRLPAMVRDAIREGVLVCGVPLEELVAV